MNKKLIFVFIVVSLFLIGCDGKDKDNRPITDVDIRKGTVGLTMQFVQNAPPERIFEDSIFPIAVELKNKGAFDIGDDEGILVFGFEKTYVDFAEDAKIEFGSNEELRFGIDGKSVVSPEGNDELVTISGQAKSVGPQSETHPSTILATVCYPYETVFGSSVCVDTDVYDIEKEQKVCSIQDLIFEGGQGAPVAVTKIETRMLLQDDNKVKPHFIIYVKNKGNGEVVDLDKIKNVCSSEKLEYTDFNTLVVSASLSGVPLKCGEEEGEGPATIRLRDKEDIIRCTLEEGGGIDATKGAYTAPLRIEFDYGYTFTISKDIIIEKILTY